MKPVALHAVGLCAAGLAGWAAARAILPDPARFSPGPPPRPSPAALPATERRRASATARWALEAAGDAVRGLPPATVSAFATVFASADGDGEVLAAVLRALAEAKITMSPTTFHNSVFNAPAGYWSIAAQAPAASVTLCAGGATFAAGLIEAASQVDASDAPVLLVAYDLPFPGDAPIRTSVREPFACALLLGPVAGSLALGTLEAMALAPAAGIDDAADPIAAYFAGNPTAASLPLLAAVARGVAAVLTLPYQDGDGLSVRWCPR